MDNKCTVCKVSCEVEPLYRNNAKGVVPADMRCFKDLDNPEAIAEAEKLIETGIPDIFYSGPLGEPWHD